MKVYFALLIILLFNNACTINRIIAKQQLKPLEANKVYSIANVPYKAYNEKLKSDSIRGEYENFCTLIGIDKAKSNSVSIFIKKEKKLVISFLDSYGVQQTNTYKGKFTNNGSYYVKLTRRNISIPFVYTQRDLEKFRFFQSSTGELVMYYKNIREGALLIFGAGSTYGLLYYFKPIE